MFTLENSKCIHYYFQSIILKKPGTITRIPDRYSEFWECGGSYPMSWIYLHSLVGTGNKELNSAEQGGFYMFW